jgi:Mor family transcriptional regulator
LYPLPIRASNKQRELGEKYMNNVIKKLSEKYELSESVIRTILKNHLNQNK